MLIAEEQWQTLKGETKTILQHNIFAPLLGRSFIVTASTVPDVCKGSLRNYSPKNPFKVQSAIYNFPIFEFKRTWGKREEGRTEQTEQMKIVEVLISHPCRM